MHTRTSTCTLIHPYIPASISSHERRGLSKRRLCLWLSCHCIRLSTFVRPLILCDSPIADHDLDPAIYPDLKIYPNIAHIEPSLTGHPVEILPSHSSCYPHFNICMMILISLKNRAEELTPFCRSRSPQCKKIACQVTPGVLGGLLS